jgi:hypothetical protein
VLSQLSFFLQHSFERYATWNLSSFENGCNIDRITVPPGEQELVLSGT